MGGGHTQEVSQGSFVCAMKGDWFQLAPVWKLFFRPESQERGNLPVPRMTHSQAAEAGSQQGGGDCGLCTPCIFRARNGRHVPCSTGGNEASSEGERINQDPVTEVPGRHRACVANEREIQVNLQLISSKDIFTVGSFEKLALSLCWGNQGLNPETDRDQTLLFCFLFQFHLFI